MESFFSTMKRVELYRTKNTNRLNCLDKRFISNPPQIPKSKGSDFEGIQF